MQYSSTLVFSTPLNTIPTPRSNNAASWCGLLGLMARRSGGVSVMGWSLEKLGFTNRRRPVREDALSFGLCHNDGIVNISLGGTDR